MGQRPRHGFQRPRCALEPPLRSSACLGALRDLCRSDMAAGRSLELESTMSACDWSPLVNAARRVPAACLRAQCHSAPGYSGRRAPGSTSDSAMPCPATQPILPAPLHSSRTQTQAANITSAELSTSTDDRWGDRCGRVRRRRARGRRAGSLARAETGPETRREGRRTQLPRPCEVRRRNDVTTRQKQTCSRREDATAGEKTRPQARREESVARARGPVKEPRAQAAA